MVDDYDDEQTLAEEEALAAGENPQEEIDDLQKEGEMSIEELMALYGCGPPKSDADSSTASTSTSRKRKLVQSTPIVDPPTKSPPPDDETESNVDEEESDVEQESELKKLIKTEDAEDAESNDEQDIDYLPEKDDAKKVTILYYFFQK